MHQRTFHPIRHLLFLQFLNVDVEELFLLHKELYKPFGHGPWECFNPASEHFGDFVIDKVILSVKDKRTIGTFRCSCGFVYTLRAGDDPKNGINIKQFGHVWRKECKRLAEAGMSLQDIGRRLHANKRTVKKYIEVEEAEQEEVELSDENRREDDRMEWKSLQKEHPDLSRTELRKLHPTLFNRLYRLDRSWLEVESPTKVKKRNPSKPRINWLNRDQELVEKIREAVINIQEMAGKPKQISVSSIGHAIGYKSLLEKQIEKLPLSKVYLERVVEGNENYRLRRLQWAIEELKREGREFSKWEVLRKAGIRPETVDSSLIETMISSVDPSFN